jgi:hypothetical protein
VLGVRLRSIGAALVLALVASVVAVTAHDRQAAADPLFVEWPALLPGLADGFDVGSSNVCVSGKIGCMDALVREMERRYEPLRDTCSDQALFALTYLRVTETYAWSARQPGYYQDPAWTNHAVAVFAKYYLRAFDTWMADNNSPNVPQAWKIAFDGARDGTLMGSGNFLLGLNAHINHDLALAMAAAGLAQADGQSAKPNYDKIDALLNSVTNPLVAELSARFDPSMDDTTLPLNLDAVAVGNLMFLWREQAWRNAELIALAPQLTKGLVIATIEANSVTQATLYSAALSYVPSTTGRIDRTAFCAIHHDDPAPQAYPFGLPTD